MKRHICIRDQNQDEMVEMEIHPLLMEILEGTRWVSGIDADMCYNRRHKSFTCTRVNGHTGPHVAHGGHD